MKNCVFHISIMSVGFIILHYKALGWEGKKTTFQWEELFLT